ncbi:MAG: N-6 DNA methylase [Atopobiaceae bacterium]|nr:N-6 DNA methylase [Atopobiaceae bacterium]
MTLANLVKRLEDIMRSDTGIDGTAQRLSQIVWLLFLKAFDYAEQEAEWDDDFEPTIPVGYRWRDWATCENEDGEPDVRRQLTGDALIQFVNNELLPVLRGDAIKVDGEDRVIFEGETAKALLVKDFMRRTINYSQNGIQLRLMVNLFDEVDFAETEDTHEFNDVYEEMLKSLQSAGRAGEFYTPRALTSFAIRHVNPKIKNATTGLPDRVGDFACGTGGFLVDAYRHLRAQVGNDVDADEAIKAALHGQEWKPLPYMLCVTNLMLKGISEPDIAYGDALARKLSDYGSDEQMDVIAMNPPYGGVALEVDKLAFPADVRSSETFDLFMSLIIKRLVPGGRAVVILPDGFMFGDGVKATIKKNLMSQCNLHTVIRLPQSCFAPYTSITTNMLFFDKTGPTKETWFYRMDMPEGYKHFSKTKPVLPRHMEVIDEWWDNRTELVDDEGWQKAKCYSYHEIEERNFNLDLCSYPTEKVEVLSPEDTIRNYQERREHLDNEIDAVLAEIRAALGMGDE